MAKTIQQKMRHPEKPVVRVLTEPRGPNFPAGKMLIATPTLIDSAVRQIVKGETITVTELRKMLAEQFGADYACPLTTGLFLRIVAENAERERSEGNVDIAPYWRVTQSDRSMNPRFPGGTEAQAYFLSEEGHRLITKGKKISLV